MSILQDAAQAEYEELITEKEPFEPDYIDEEPTPEASPLHIDFSFLKTPTGAGSIDSYIDHPLNAHGSRAVAQIIRGLTGFAGSLDLAVIDITLGLIELTREQKKPAAAPKPAGVNYEPIIKG